MVEMHILTQLMLKMQKEKEKSLCVRACVRVQLCFIAYSKLNLLALGIDGI